MFENIRMEKVLKYPTKVEVTLKHFYSRKKKIIWYSEKLLRYSSEKQKINDLRHRATETWSWVVYWQSAAQEDAERQSTDNNIVLVSSRQGHPNVVVRRCYNSR